MRLIKILKIIYVLCSEDKESSNIQQREVIRVMFLDVILDISFRFTTSTIVKFCPKSTIKL